MLVIGCLAVGQVWHDAAHDQGIAEFQRNRQREVLEYMVREGEVNIFIASSAFALAVEFHAWNWFFFVLQVVGVWWWPAGHFVLGPILLLTELAAVGGFPASNADFGSVGGATCVGAAFGHGDVLDNWKHEVDFESTNEKSTSTGAEFGVMSRMQVMWQSK